MSEVRSWHLVSPEGAPRASAVVVPAWGANVVAAVVQHPELAWPTPLLESVDIATVALKPTSYGIPVLSPTPGRVGSNENGVFHYKGGRYRTVTRHGFLRQHAWEVADSAPGRITCRLQVRPSNEREAFPFHLDVRYDIELVPAGVRCMIRFDNTGDRTQPVDMGWHPYIHRGGACRVLIPAASRWEPDHEEEPTPTGRIVPVEPHQDFRAGRVIPETEHWDETLTGIPESDEVSCWTEETSTVRTKSGGSASATVRRRVTFRARNGAGGVRGIRHVQLFTPPSRAALCIEPFSAAPNAVNLVARQVPGVEIGEIEPGAHVVYEMTLAADITLG
jgi:aldose 1-epimerase